MGLLLLLVFFGSKYVAGLAGQEELLFFLLGACLVLVEVFLVPGLLLPGLLVLCSDDWFDLLGYGGCVAHS